MLLLIRIESRLSANTMRKISESPMKAVTVLRLKLTLTVYCKRDNDYMLKKYSSVTLDGNEETLKSDKNA